MILRIEVIAPSEIRDKLFSSTLPSFTLHVTHILAYTKTIPLFSWVSALDLHTVSALGSRVGWTPARKNEQTNEHMKAFQVGLLDSCCTCS